MVTCPVCRQAARVSGVVCGRCNIKLEGSFQLPRLARLSAENRKLAEELVFSGGNLKELAANLDVSYPTLRKRVDSMIEELHALRSIDEAAVEGILADIEAGRISADEGLRHIKEVNGEL